MRVTDKLMFDSAQSNASLAAERMQDAQFQAQTGIRVQHPGDDPGAAALILTHRASIDRLSGIATSMSRANEELITADGALGTVQTLLGQAQLLATQMANGTYSASDRAGAAPQIQNVIGQIVSAMNAKVGSRYLFGGNVDNAPPFDPTTGNYTGDGGVRQIEIAPGVLQNVSLRADTALAGANGNVSAFTTLQNLQIALQSNDQVGINAAIDQLNTVITQVADTRAVGGTYQSALLTATTINASAQGDEKADISHLEDADAIAAASQLQLSQNALQAAISAASKLFQFTLADKLR